MFVRAMLKYMQISWLFVAVLFALINGSQLANMKKYIPHMSLPWNL